MITIQNIDPQMIANNLEPAYPTNPGEVLKPHYSLPYFVLDLTYSAVLLVGSGSRNLIANLQARRR